MKTVHGKYKQMLVANDIDYYSPRRHNQLERHV